MTQTIHRFSISQVTQGKHKFYTCTIPSDILGRCCFVSTRDEDPEQGFQRVLDKKRAIEIARYIDSGLGTIPSSIILSAQPEANLEIIGKGKTLQFVETNKSFLILDGQHRVFGFSLAESTLRVPVVIYNGLSRRDESRLFIDINSKQRGVSNELLLDIKQLADYEDNVEQLMRAVFDLFNKDTNSAFFNGFSPSSRESKKISRVTFNAALKPILSLFSGKEAFEIFTILNNYFIVFKAGLNNIDCPEALQNSTVFKGVSGFFPIAASKLKDRFGSDYSIDNFEEVLQIMFSKIKPAKIKRPGNSFRSLVEYFELNIKSDFSL